MSPDRPHDPRAAEARRQCELVEALLADRADTGTLPLRGPPALALRGLQAYRANAHAGAARALGTAFPTAQALVGEERFTLLARDFWRASPPVRGDLREWGEDFPGWLAAEVRLAEWPYFADCARLDWALHRCESAEDGTLDPASLHRLGDTDPARLQIVLAPGVAVVESRWPIARILHAHGSGDPEAFDAARAAIAQEEGEEVVVARDGWKAVACAVDKGTAHFMRQLLQPHDLAGVLALAHPGFDFAAWLARALPASWVKGIVVLPD